MPGLLGPAVVGAVLRHPRLWPTAAVQWRRLTPTRWWARRPFLPVPDREWVRFRLQTQYGGDGRGGVRPEDVVSFLQWCREVRRHERAAW